MPRTGPGVRFELYAGKWGELSEEEQEEWNAKGEMKGQSGFTYFVNNYEGTGEEKELIDAEEEEEEYKKRMDSIYFKGRECDCCNTNTLLREGEILLVCDICGEVHLI